MNVIHRLAAANPVTALEVPRFDRALPRRRRAPQRALVLAAAAVAVAVPAAALSDFFGLSNGGTPVPTASVFGEAPELTQAEQELQFPAQVQDLGVLDGTTFYVTQNAAGKDCFALSGAVQAIWCDFADPFPSAQLPFIGLPIGRNHPGGHLVGFAADGIARIDLLDASGTVVASASVEDNLYDTSFTPGTPAASVVAYDGAGKAVFTRELLP